MVTKISSLPDYAALKKLASALWLQDSSYHGAAVMVGAGFSRCAAISGDATQKLPLWSGFSEALIEELDSKSTDPLRLAEEYCAYYGRQALHDLIKKKINDAAWTPGELHRSLLELPWSEVLTTNWDTLIERASTEVHHRVYSIVSKQEDLSSARPPRIVKLHGTIEVTKELVFTQEDYRKYPQQHAAFVNFSRQVFIENELCLLGFSGDDPNFYQWAGWVRDHLANHSRRIYLVGALGLNSAKRKYLESINVAPIDLNDLVADYDEQDARHLAAAKIFIQALHDLKPEPIWEWRPTNLHRSIITGAESNRTHQDISYAAKLLEEKLPSLEKDRFAYPGWLICPNMQRFEVQSQISDPWPTRDNLSQMSTIFRAKLLYEITWHHQITYEALPTWLANELLSICDPITSSALTKKQQLEIALLLLKNTRWMDKPDAECIAKKTSEILESGEKYWPESANELAYHNAIMARDRFDYAAMEQYLEKFINSNDSVWKLRKASLLAELGQFDKGEILVADAYKELLNHYRNDRNSIHVLSRLAWAHWLMRGIDLSLFSKEFKAFPTNYRESKCDPWDFIEHLRDRISKVLDKQQKHKTIEPLFEPGRYKDNSNTVSYSNELHPLLLLEGISGSVGMPLRWNNVIFFADHAAKLAELDDLDNVHRFALAIRAANSETSNVLNKAFSRVQIACFSQDDVSFLLNQCKLAIDYWTKKCQKESGNVKRLAIERLRVFIEVLARISVRVEPEQAKQLFRLAVSLSKTPEFHHDWLLDAIEHLTEFSLKSIPNSMQHEILLDALSIPLQSELNVKLHSRLANPIIKNPGERKQDAMLDRRVDEIIDSIAPCSSQSASSLSRLIPLIETGFLNTDEIRKITEKLWGPNPDYQALPETGLLKYVFLKFPSQDTAAVRTLVRRYLFDAKDSDLIDRSLLTDIVNAATAESIKEFPSADQAVAYFKSLVAWRPQKNGEGILKFVRDEERQIAELIAEVLAQSVVPSLSLEALTEENFQKLCSFHAEVDTPQVLIAFSYFAAANDFFIEQLETLIKHGFQSNDKNKLAYASFTLLKWRGFKESPSIDKLVLRLIYLIGSNRITALPALLWAVNKIYCNGHLSDENVESLVEILPVIFDNSEYRNIPPSSRESISISFVRAACVKLARDINKDKRGDNELKRILDEAMDDPLPEVRFAGTS